MGQTSSGLVVTAELGTLLLVGGSRSKSGISCGYYQALQLLSCAVHEQIKDHDRDIRTQTSAALNTPIRPKIQVEIIRFGMASLRASSLFAGVAKSHYKLGKYHPTEVRCLIISLSQYARCDWSTGKYSVGNLQYGPRTRLVRGM